MFEIVKKFVENKKIFEQTFFYNQKQFFLILFKFRPQNKKKSIKNSIHHLQKTFSISLPFGNNKKEFEKFYYLTQSS